MSSLQVVCPLCPLHCDDIDPSALSLGRTGCHRADSQMNAIVRSACPTVSAQVLEECRQWVAQAKRIVIDGDVIDLETSRAIADFMDATGAELGVIGDSAYADAFSREGAFTTTLGELTARETSMLVIGDPASHWPRINEKLSSIAHRVDWECSSRLPTQLASLRHKLTPRSPVQASEESDAAVEAAFELVRQSKYLVVLVAPDAFREAGESPVRADIAWASLLGMIRELNQTTRASLLNFDRSLTVRSVVASRGLASTLNFPRSDESLCIYFSPLGKMPANKKMRTIVIGRCDQPLGSEMRLLPASVAGVHHAGIVMRGDGSVTLPLQAPLSNASFLTPAQQLRSLL